MSFLVNGEQTPLPNAGTLAGYLAAQGLLDKHIVIELNGAIRRRDEWDSILLQAGDALEIVAFVGGG